MNPYESPVTLATTQVKSDLVACRKRNPAKRYLIACAILCLVGTIVTLVELSSILLQGPARHLFTRTTAFIAFGLYFATSAYLAFGKFGKVQRVFTVVWALVAAMGIIFVITYVDPVDPTDARNFPGMIILAGCFALLGYISWLCISMEPNLLTTDLKSP